MEINIEDLTLKQIREISAMAGGNKQNDDAHWKIGENYFIRSVTHHYTGKLIKITEKEFVFVNAAWIADDGRFAEAVKTGLFSEVEVYPANQEVIIGRGGFLDGIIIPVLPTSTK